MKLTDFSIAEINLTHDQAIALKQSIIDAIENYGIENFEKKREIQLSKEENDIFDIYVECEIYTEYKGSFQEFNEPPEAEEIESRSVMELVIHIINSDGDEVSFTVLGRKDPKSRFIHTPIDIEEEVIKHFEI